MIGKRRDGKSTSLWDHYRELTRDRNLGLAKPVALGELCPPSLDGGPFRDAGQQNPGCFKQITSQHRVAALRDATCPIDLS